MANTFLPFIVESSTPLNVFKTLLSRSKGMNEILLASVFYLVTSVPIKKLRDTVKDLPDMPLEQLYEELIQKYPQYQMQEGTVEAFRYVIQFFPTDNLLWSTELDEFERKDVMIFFAVLCYARKDISEYTDINFQRLGNKDPDESAAVLNNIKFHVMFDDKGEKVTFKNKRELAGFILYNAFFSKEADYPGKPDKALPHSYCAVMAEIKP